MDKNRGILYIYIQEPSERDCSGTIENVYIYDIYSCIFSLVLVQEIISLNCLFEDNNCQLVFFFYIFILFSIVSLLPLFYIHYKKKRNKKEA